MSKILVYTSPARGHLYPIMETALELSRRGHHLSIRTLAGEVDVVRAAGLEARPLSPQIESRPLDDWQSRSPIASVKRSLATFLDRASFEVEDLSAAIREERPDLLLIDTNAWGAQAVAEASGLPWATWHPFPLPLPAAGVPPFGPGLAPAAGFFGRLRDRVLQPLALAPLEKVVPALNEVRRRTGASVLSSIVELFAKPPLLLHLTAEPFEYPRKFWPANIALVGPGLWSPPAAEAPWLAQITKPIVLATCSTEYQADGQLVEAAIEAFGSDPGVQLVCTTAGVDPTTFRAPAGVIVERFAPHALVLPRSVAVICHGGMGITQRALAAGVAPCIVPWGRDQLEVARRVTVARAGARLARGKLEPGNLRAAVEAARACTEGVERVRAGFVAAGGAPRAATLIAELARARAA